MPGVVTLATQLRSISLGSTWLSYKYTGSGEQVVELSITIRLGDTYRPQRFVGRDLDVASVRPATSRFLFSVGLGGVIGDRVTYTLDSQAAPQEPSEGQPAPAQQFAVQADTARKLALAPSAILTMSPMIAVRSKFFGV